jgi:hypothetical protein
LFSEPELLAEPLNRPLAKQQRTTITNVQRTDSPRLLKLPEHEPIINMESAPIELHWVAVRSSTSK